MPGFTSTLRSDVVTVDDGSRNKESLDLLGSITLSCLCPIPPRPWESSNIRLEFGMGSHHIALRC